MKKQNTLDERVITQRRKVNSEAFGILMIALVASMLIQQFLLKAPFVQYVAELICFIGMALYMIIRYIMLGINIYDDEKQTKSSPLINSLVSGVVVTLVTGVLNYLENAERYKIDGIGYFIAMLAITLISSSVFTYIILSCANFFNNKKQAQIEKEMDENE